MTRASIVAKSCFLFIQINWGVQNILLVFTYSYLIFVLLCEPFRIGFSGECNSVFFIFKNCKTVVAVLAYVW